MATSVVPKQLSILDVYPVGAIYISVSSTPPDELFGGTWEVFGTGRTLVGISASETEFDTVEKTGGEKTHKLTITEMPSHNHRIGGWITITYGSGWTAIWDYWGGDRQNYSASVGGSQAHNNIQPYITVYMWKRTA